MAANAQTNIIKINPTSFIVNTFNLSFEHAVGNKMSFQFGAYYTLDLRFFNDEISGFGLTPEYRFYLGGKDAQQGFFLGPYLRYQNYISNALYHYETSTTFGGGVNVGYQRIFGEHFALEPFIRLGYNSVLLDTGVIVLPGLNLGFAF
ncbi:MAG: hypothetical protein NVS3B25_00130 [Hymenobacter sp.]